MGEALYRKHRSKTLDEVVGQEHITATLKRALKSGLLSHAYLFTGPRGVGKTSIARILAHEVNNLPYDSSANHLDIIEIDAASNRRIDEIRELRERVHTAPASAKYKVYIIDEVHMLTKEAFNALLKTLEEPPAHVIFILATTEAHKLPETIISRTQRFSFKPIAPNAAVNHLATIAKAEGIDIEPAALELIAEHGGGSFRDSIGLLDQVRGLGDKITKENVQTLLGIPPSSLTDEILADISSGDKQALVKRLARLREQGFLSSQLAKQLARATRERLIENRLPFDEQTAGWLLKELVAVPASHDPDTLLEIVLLTIPGGKPKTAQPKTPPTLPTGQKLTEPIKKAAEKPAPIVKDMKQRPPSALNDELWQEALNALKQKYNTLYSIARMATAIYEGQTLVLEFGFAFHQKRLNETGNRQVIADIVSQLAGRDITIESKLDPHKKPPAAPKPQIKKETSAPVDTISNIFGGAEVIE